MTLMTATESQVGKAIHDLGVWQSQPSKSESTKTPSRNMDSLDSGDMTPLFEADYTMDSTPSGRISPLEAVTPPNDIEALVKIEQSSGRESPLSFELEPTTKPAPRPVELVVAPQTETAEAEVPQIQLESVEPTSAVAIRAPSTYDAEAPASTRLRHMIKNLDHILVCPGVYDGLSARIALSCGFEGMYMTGAGTNASRLGMADLGIAHLHDMRTNAEMIANLKPDGAPVIADMDTGYGGPMVIDRSLQQYHLAGVAGFHIEDQVMQKRCGHLAGKEVVDIDTYISRIKACVAAAKRLRSDIVVIARTDALQSRGYDDCITRLRRARDEGADMGILEGFATKAQARQAVKDLAPWPLCLNSVENGVSPVISVDEAQDMGFRVIIFSFASISPAYTAIRNTFEWLKEYGVTGSSVSPKTIFNVCGLQDLMVIDEQAGGDAFKKGV